MYLVMVMFSAQRSTVPKSIASTIEALRTSSTVLSVRVPPMAEPTFSDVDALVGPATPHFAYQLRARVEELVSGLPEDNAVRQYGEAQMKRLDDLGHASSKADEGERVSPDRLGWDEIPSSAPADAPLPR